MAAWCCLWSLETSSPGDNPDNLVSQEVEQAVDLAVAVFFLPALLLLSVPTNVVNMLVFWRHGVRERINLCLFCLSLADLIYIIHFLFSTTWTSSTSLLLERQVWGSFFSSSSTTTSCFLRAFYWESGFLSMLIACERCLCVYSPLQTQRIFKTSTTALAIIFSTLVHHGFTYIGASRWGTACVFDPVTNSTSNGHLPNKVLPAESGGDRHRHRHRS